MDWNADRLHIDAIEGRFGPFILCEIGESI